MLRSFCKMGAIKSLLECSGCPDILKQCSEILEDHLSRNRLDPDTQMFSTEEHISLRPLPSDYSWGKLEIIDPEILFALKSAFPHLQSRIDNWTTPGKALRLRHVKICNTNFTDYRTAVGHPIIFFQPIGTEERVPGRIATILSVPVHTGAGYQELCFVVVQRFLPLSNGEDPFLSFPRFGACVRMLDFSETFEIVPTWNRLLHAVHRKWGDKMIVLKAIDN